MNIRIVKPYAYISVLMAALAFTMTSCEKEVLKEVEKIVYAEQAGSLTLNFDSRFGAENFELDKKYPYQLTNASGTFDMEFEFDRFRYWVSNVKLVTATGEEVLIPHSYYLIEETGEISIPHLVTENKYPATKREAVEIKGVAAGEYSGVKFSIGVAPRYNDNITLSSGELGILNGMGFSDGWMWFTSYIFQNLQGKVHWAASPDRDNEGNPIITKSLRWDSGSNELYIGAERSFAFPNSVKIDAQNAGRINFEVDVKELLETTDLPWANNVISQSKKDLMKAFRDALLDKSVTLKGVETIAIAAE